MSPDRPRRLGRPPKISRQRVIETGALVAREQGLDAVGLRPIADRLSVAPVTLYGHITDKEELVDAVVEYIVEQHELTFAWPETWEDALVAYATEFRAVLLRNPELIQAFQRRPILAPHALAMMDRLLGLLVGGGLSEPDAVDLYAAVHAWTVTSATRAHQRRVTAVRQQTTERALADAVERELSAHTDLPSVHSAAAHIARAHDDDHFVPTVQLLIQAAHHRMQNTSPTERATP